MAIIKKQKIKRVARSLGILLSGTVPAYEAKFESQYQKQNNNNNKKKLTGMKANRNSCAQLVEM